MIKLNQFNDNIHIDDFFFNFLNLLILKLI